MLYIVLIALIVSLAVVYEQKQIAWPAFLAVTAPIWIGTLLLLLAGCSPLHTP